MGKAKNKKQRFLAAHPFCCFCGGTEPATTIDHAPPRTCFPDRIGPDQRASRIDEMAVGFFVRLVDPDETNYREDQTSKALLGIKNNVPDVIPLFHLPGAARRRFYKEFDIQRPVGVFSSDLPVVGVPEEAH
jgi:hypothetical protein